MSERFRPYNSDEYTCRKRYPTESGVYVPYSETGDPILLPYKQWKKKPDLVDPGTFIIDIPPKELFTTQDWLDPEKMKRAMVAQDEMYDDAYTVPGVIFEHPKDYMGFVLVLLEGNHRAVHAAHTGHRINFQVTDHILDISTNVWCVSNLIHQSGVVVR